MIEPIQCDMVAFAERVAALLVEQNKTLAVAESCTGGWLSKVLTDLPGSSQWFLGGVVSYSNQAKHQLLGVDEHCIQRVGAVSEAVARQMAQGAVQAFSSKLAISTTGIAGPSGGTTDKPLGTVCFAIQDGQKTIYSGVHQFKGSREQVRRQAVSTALSLLIDILAR